MIPFYSFAIAFVLTEILLIKTWDPWLNRKPFKCMVCLSGWIAFIYTIGTLDVLYIIGTMAISMVLTLTLNSLIKQYL